MVRLVAQLVGGEPEFSLEADGGSGVAGGGGGIGLGGHGV